MPEARMLCRYNVETPMRDGVMLRCDVYAPAEPGQYPALLMRTVFRKRDMGRAFGQYDPAYFVRRGYAVVIQDVRGLGESEGEFDRFTADGPDGYDTIEWLAAQPFCDGHVGMIGSYFAGYLQLMAAAEKPPHLDAICPWQTSMSINRDCDNRGFLFSSHVGWCMSRLVNRLRDGRYDEATTREWLPRLLDALTDYPQRQLTALPLRSMPILRDAPFDLLRSYERHLIDGYDDFALLHKEGRDMDMARVDTPAFYVCGWYDSSRTPLIDHCLAQRARGIDSRVLIAPWKPGEPPVRADGALENGVYAVDVQREMADWFDHWLKGGPAPAFAPVRYGDMANQSIPSGGVWPPEGGAESDWYLGVGHGLTPERPGTLQGEDAYLHDPCKPLPYRGYGWQGADETGDERVTAYLSEPLDTALTVRGLARALLHVSSTAKDADVMVRVSDVAPDGRAFVFCDGATRMRYREDWTPRPLEADQVYPVTVLLGHVSYTVAQGHRLLLEVSGSAFPKYDVNHGTGRRPADDAEMVACRCSVHWGKDACSRLMLPLELSASN